MKALSEQLKKDQFISVKDIVQLIGLSKSTVYRMKDSGKLPFYKFGRRVLFKYSDVQIYIESLRINAFQNEYGSSKTKK